MERDNLEALLAQQKMCYRKGWIGLYTHKKQKSYKNLFNFTKACSPFTICHYCTSKGHYFFRYMIKRYGVPSGKYKWILKRTNKLTNQKGPKTTWVPISTF